MNYKVYVTLGFHINFYHSWRGDTPDEAGFGTDIRVIREVLKILNRANEAGLQARGYWDTEVYWTFQEILPKHSPDILEAIRRRVDAGLDEIVLGPFNNGANHAATEDEFRAAVAWAIENPWGSGLKQLFGKVSPFYRPQETMFTTGQESILKEFGVDGLILYYAGVPFNTISNFIPVLKDEQRYNPLWFRSREDQPPLILLTCIAAADLIEQVSLENLMLNLHQRQERGEIESDVLIHINEDADLETWLPVKMPAFLKWFPNTGGLEEFIRVVNTYPWAEFTLPSEYTSNHAPKAEILVRQDLADGGFDGNYSWAEKCASLCAWTLLEQSRLASNRANMLAKRSGMDLSPVLWDGMDSSFFQRLIGLTTTHFGMSTPIINEERQNKALAILGNARQVALDAECTAARACRQPARPSLYDIELYPAPASRNSAPRWGRVPVNLPIVLPAGVHSVRAEDESGGWIRSSLTDMESLPDGKTSARVRFVMESDTAEAFRITLQPAEASPAQFTRQLKNEWLEVVFSEKHGIETFTFDGELVGVPGFLDPFVTYGRRTFRSTGYELIPLTGETWDGMQRVRLKTSIPMQTPEGEAARSPTFASTFFYTFSLFDDLPCLLVDVEAHYAYTPPRQIIHNLMQKLRRLMDLHWVETAPFQLTPVLTAPAEKPLRVWKHNYMGVTAYYDLNYGQINPKNRSLDSFNHQVTAGWVAVSNGKRGILIGEDAQTLASMAFCPMRLQERGGVQSISLNPFGSYYGKQLDYSHLGGNNNGSVFMQAFSGALQPNAPSFNGETLRFSLMLAPYAGDEPPEMVQNAASAHFYPPGVLFNAAPSGMEVITAEDMVHFIAAERRRAALEADKPLIPPGALLANPSPNAVDLVWDAPRGIALTGYEIQWRSMEEPDWHSTRIGDMTRWHIENVEDGKPLQFRMRSLRSEGTSTWTAEKTCTPGAVTGSSVTSMLGRVPLWTLLRVVAASIWSVLRIKVYQAVSRQERAKR